LAERNLKRIASTSQADDVVPLSFEVQLAPRPEGGFLFD